MQFLSNDVAEDIVIPSGTTWDRMIRYGEGRFADEANRARPEFVRQVRNSRVVIRNLRRRTGQDGSTNILSMQGGRRGELAMAINLTDDAWSWQEFLLFRAQQR